MKSSSSSNSSNHQKLKTPPRSSHLFSCAFFRHCTHSVLSPTAAPSSPSHSHQQQQPPSSSSSSSSSSSQSFTQWRFPLPPSHPPQPSPQPKPQPPIPPSPSPPSLPDAFHQAHLHFSSSPSQSSRLAALHLLEHSLVPTNNGGSTGSTTCVCPITVARGVVACLRDGVARRAASKVLLAVSLMEVNRLVVVEAGAVSAIVEVLADAESATAERSLAALELLCTTGEGAGEVRAHALAVPMMVQVMGRMEGRGKEHAISVLAVIYGGEGGGGVGVAPAEEVARAVMLALEGECSARGRRKGAQLLKILREGDGMGMDEGGRDGR